MTGLIPAISIGVGVTTWIKLTNSSLISISELFVFGLRISKGHAHKLYSSPTQLLLYPDRGTSSIRHSAPHQGQITNLKVNVKITHPRPDDLLVYLIGPAGGDPVRLMHLTGDNPVANFNDTNSLGVWTLDIHDIEAGPGSSRKPKTGTLNSWSVMILAMSDVTQILNAIERGVPQASDFAEWVLKTPKEQRHGLVFGTDLDGQPMAPAAVPSKSPRSSRRQTSSSTSKATASPAATNIDRCLPIARKRASHPHYGSSSYGTSRSRRR